MIIKDDDAVARLNSPFNLINQMKNLSDSSGVRKSAMSLFIRPEVKPNEATKKPQPPAGFNPFPEKQTEILEVVDNTPTSLNDIVENHETKIQLAHAHDNALRLLNNSVNMLAAKLDDVHASKLPSVIAAASKTVESIRRERLEQSKNSKDREVHYHFYTPQQKKLSDYEVVEVAQ